ncbi:GGDEF domain-containing protein [Alteromonas sp. CYL-A6]|uniref:GGDEF domain-containing protein n=1 Tax=Alteromonas nitratireducens TaxID=3390813 RepID=UPI0034C42CB4
MPLLYLQVYRVGSLMDPHASSIQLVIVISVLTAFCAFAWLLLASPLNIYKTASRQFAVSNMLMATGFFLTIFRDASTSVTAWLLNDLVLVAAFVYYKKAVYTLFRLPASGNFDVAVVFSALTLIGWSLAFTPSVSTLSAINAIFCMLALVLTVNANVRGLRDALGLTRALTLSMPAIAISVVLFIKAFSLMLAPDFASTFFIRPQVDSPDMLWGYFIALLFANAAAFGSALMRLIIKIRQLADHDQLTGLLNRRAIQREFSQSASLHERAGTPFSLLLIDIDFFKQINDEQGHEAGDEAIRHVASLLQSTFRHTDRVCRYGGEEFLVLLNSCTLEEAIRAAEKLRSEIMTRTFVWNGSPLPLRISAGCASTSQAVPTKSLLNIADKQLYLAKNNGRNCVMPALSDISTD